MSNIFNIFKFQLIVLAGGMLVLGYPSNPLCLELTVDQAITTALYHNYGLRVEVEESNKLLSEVTKKKAAYIPELKFDTSYRHNENKPDLIEENQDEKEYSATIEQLLPYNGQLALKYGSGDTDKSYSEVQSIDDDNYSSSIDIRYTQPLLKGGVIGPNYTELKDAEYSSKVQEAVLSNNQVELVNNVRATFYQMVSLQKEVELDRNALEISENILSNVRSRFAMGITPEMNVLRGQIEMSDSQLDLLNSIENLEVVSGELKNLLGVKTPLIVSGQLEVDLSLLDVQEVTSKVLRQNQQISLLKDQIKKQEFTAKVSENQLLPQLDLFVNYQLDGEGRSRGSADNFDGNVFQVGLKASYPLENSGLKASHSQEKAELRILSYKLKELETHLTNGVFTLIKKIKSLNERILIYDDQQKIIDKRLDLALKAFEKGLIRIDNLYDARDDMLNAKKKYLSVKLERIQEWAALQALMGKGYSATASLQDQE